MSEDDTDEAIEDVLRRLHHLSSSRSWALASVAVVDDVAGCWMAGADPNSSFHLGSITKTFTALTLASLCQSGRLRLSDPIDTYLGAGRGSGVRLLDLATHTAGYPRLPARLLFRMSRRPTDPYSSIRGRDVDRALARETRRHSGTSYPFAYSNFGYGLLGRALEAAGHDSFADLVHAEVLGPLA